MMKAKIGILIVIACLFVIGEGGMTGEGGDGDIPQTQNSLLLPYFKEAYPEKEIILLSEGDCNADGIDDLVVVYRENENKNHMVTVYSHDGGYSLTNHMPAPFEDCKLEWKDVSERGQLDLVISGRRGIHYGISVLRFDDGEWINLFGGMEECC